MNKIIKLDKNNYMGLISLASKHQNVYFFEVDVDQNSELANKFSIRGIPAVFLIKGNEVVDSFSGVLSEKEIDDKIRKYK